jgi:uncharacterized protein YaaN involved in tellurite resistance
VSEKLMNGLVTTKRELEAGLADAEAELARTEEYCRKLEEIIAVGRATLHAASQLNFQAAQQRSAGSNDAAPSTDVTDLQKRLAKDGAK